MIRMAARMNVASIRPAVHPQVTATAIAHWHLTYETLERGFEVDRLTSLRRGSGYEQAKAKLRCIESDEVAVAFGPPA
jgi:hypothetical protein